MIEQRQGLIDSIRKKFMHVDTCPFEGERIFFENAGGSLRLKSVVETSALYASYPDNQGRENDASKALVKSIETGKAKMRLFFNADRGDVMVGESGTELLFRLIRTAATELPEKGAMLSSTLEHRGRGQRYAGRAGTRGRGAHLSTHGRRIGREGDREGGPSCPPFRHSTPKQYGDVNAVPS